VPTVVGTPLFCLVGGYARNRERLHGERCAMGAIRHRYPGSVGVACENLVGIAIQDLNPSADSQVSTMNLGAVAAEFRLSVWSARMRFLGRPARVAGSTRRKVLAGVDPATPLRFAQEDGPGAARDAASDGPRAPA